jgi:NAD(P)H dehydrogenase (quinone)
MLNNQVRVLITGATGQVGRAVIARLANDRELDVVGSSRAPETADLGVPMLRLDYSDFATIERVLDGVDRLFILTGYTVDMLKQSKALVDHARKAGVKHIVHLGACGDDDTDVAHYGWHQFIECYIAASGIGYTHLRPEIFMQNLLGYGGVPVAQRGVIKHYVGDARMSWVDAEDIADVAAAVLRNPVHHAGKTYRLGYDAKTFHEIADIVAGVIDQPFRYEARPAAEFLDNVLKSGGEPAYMNCVYESFSRLGGEGIRGSDQTFDNFDSITGKRPAMIADFVRKHADEFRY